MPSSLAQAGIPHQAGPVRFSRRFGMPRSLDLDEHVWLCFHLQAKQTDVILNEHRLAEFVGSGRFAVECTNVLSDRNQLDVLVQAESDQDGLTGETWLEIRQAGYIQSAVMKQTPDGRITATIEVAGEWKRDLDLYLVADRKTLGYCQVSAADRHQTVELNSEEPVPGEVRTAALELVQGGVVWYRLECPIE